MRTASCGVNKRRVAVSRWSRVARLLIAHVTHTDTRANVTMRTGERCQTTRRSCHRE